MISGCMEFLCGPPGEALRPKRLDSDAALLLSQGCISGASHFQEGLISPFPNGDFPFRG